MNRENDYLFSFHVSKYNLIVTLRLDSHVTLSFRLLGVVHGLLLIHHSSSFTLDNANINLVILDLVLGSHRFEELQKQRLEFIEGYFLVHKDDDVESSVAKGVVNPRAILSVGLIVADNAPPVGLVGIESLVVRVYCSVH
jgi:hypothetical protein